MNRAVLWTALLMLATAASYQASAQPDPYQLFERARSVWLAQQYPTWLSYTIAVTVTDGGVIKTNHYKAFCDTAHADVQVEAVSEEEHADPHTPTGVNLSVRPKRNFKTIFVKPVGRPEDAVDFLGVPRLAPNYSFGVAPYVPALTDANDAGQRAALVTEIRREYNDPMPAQKEQILDRDKPLKEIANVATANRNYVVSFAGVESVQGHDTYHLHLRPVRLPTRLRLREIWIDTDTYRMSEIVTQGNFNRFGSVPWTVTFQNVDGSQYIASEVANAPLTIDRHTYRDVTVTFQEITAGKPSMVKPLIAPANPLEEPQP